jgi:hypothetical protein
VGLPFSPLFVYVREITFESPTGERTRLIEPDGAVSGGDVKINFTGEFGYTHNLHFGFFSWSFAMALLGVGLLIIAFWNVRSRSRARPHVVS